MAIRGYEPKSTALLLSKHKFCTLDDFSTFIRDIQYTFYIRIESDRVRRGILGVRELYAKLEGPAPFSVRSRFQEDSFYVHLGNAKLKAYINQIHHACDISSKLLEKGSKVAKSRLADAKRSFDAAVDELGRIVNSVDIVKLGDNGIYCLETFESNLKLTWVEAVQDATQDAYELNRKSESAVFDV